MALSLRQQAVAAALLIGLTALMFAVAAALTETRDLRVDFFTNDPVAIAEQSWSTGLISRVEVLVWSAAAGVALFAGAAARRHDPELGSALLALGLLTAVLVADDALLIHETVGDRVGAPVMQALYIALFAALAARFGRVVLSLSPWPLFVAGAGFLAASALIDSLSIDIHGVTFVEDGAKVAGILIWSAYLTATSWQATNAPPSQSPSYGA